LFALLLRQVLRFIIRDLGSHPLIGKVTSELQSAFAEEPQYKDPSTMGPFPDSGAELWRTRSGSGSAPPRRLLDRRQSAADRVIGEASGADRGGIEDVAQINDHGATHQGLQP
jgi:hypothetical protein